MTHKAKLQICVSLCPRFYTRDQKLAQFSVFVLDFTFFENFPKQDRLLGLYYKFRVHHSNILHKNECIYLRNLSITFFSCHCVSVTKHNQCGKWSIQLFIFYHSDTEKAKHFNKKPTSLFEALNFKHFCAKKKYTLKRLTNSYILLHVYYRVCRFVIKSQNITLMLLLNVFNTFK